MIFYYTAALWTDVDCGGSTVPRSNETSMLTFLFMIIALSQSHKARSLRTGRASVMLHWAFVVCFCRDVVEINRNCYLLLWHAERTVFRIFPEVGFDVEETKKCSRVRFVIIGRCCGEHKRRCDDTLEMRRTATSFL